MLTGDFNNTTGTVSFSAVTEGIPPTEEFVLATVFFEKVPGAPGLPTRLGFDKATGRKTEAVFQGASVLRELTVITAPLLVSPEDKATVDDPIPTFDWDAITTGDVTDFLLQVTSGDIINGPFDIQITINRTRFPVPPLPGVALADATYRWRVIAQASQSNGLNTATSVTRTFTVETAQVRPPALVSPEDIAFLNTRTPFFDWDAAVEKTPGALKEYRLLVTSGDIVTGPFDIDKVIPGVTNEFQVQPADALGDTTYLWRVIAKDTSGDTASSVSRTFTVDVTPPGAPALVEPVDKALLNTSTPFFKWSTAVDAVDYRLQVTSGNINTGPFDLDVLTSGDITEFQVTGDLADATYQWRVIARDRALNTAVSGDRTFTVDITPPGTPELVSPEDNASFNDRTPTFKWSTAVDAVKYRLQVTTGDIDTGPFAIEVNLLHPTIEFQVTGDLAHDTYRWRVIARDRALNTASSVTSTFTVDNVDPAPPAGLVLPLDKDFLNTRTPKPESTEGVGVRGILRGRKGAPLNLG